MSSDVRVASLLRDAEERFARAGFEAPRIEATALVAQVLRVDRGGLLARLRDPVDEETAARLDALVQRRLAHEPLQYLVGRAAFRDFDVRVGPGVFIPRPETELLVERTLSDWADEYPWALDLCSGSGAIAIALARARPNARVLAVDVSRVALRNARASARDLGVEDRIAFVRADLLTALRAPLDALGVVVCNPPYATCGDIVQPEVIEHEPRLAWEGGPTGIEVYARLLPDAARILPAGRPLLLELGYDQSLTVPELLARDGRWSAPELLPDFQGIERVLVARRIDAEGDAGASR